MSSISPKKFKKIEIIMNFQRDSEENSYQMQNKLKISENFTIDVYHSVKQHGANKIPLSFYY